MKTLGIVLILLFAFANPGLSQQVPPLTMGTVAAGVGGYTARLMHEKGIDVKHGVRIKSIEMGFDEMSNALFLGRVDLALLQPSTAVLMRKQKRMVRIFAPFNWSANQIVVPVHSAYKRLEDLKGKKVGGFPRTTGAHFFLSVLSNLKGIDVEKDFRLQPAETGVLLALLDRKEVDAIVMFDPHTSKLIATGNYRVLMDFDEEFEKLVGYKALKTGIGAREEWLKKNPELVEKIRGIYAETLALAAKDRAFFNQYGGEYFGLKTEKQFATAWERLGPQYATQWGEGLFKSQTKLLEMGISSNILPAGASTDVFWK